MLPVFVLGCAGENDWATTVCDSPVELAKHLAPGAAAVPAGFRGDKHPLLAKGESVSVEAYWTSLGALESIESDFLLHSGDLFDQSAGQFGTRKSTIPLGHYEAFGELVVAEPKRKYSAHHFSAFLPADSDLTTVGSRWSLDLPGVSRFLTQFHPAVSMHLDSTGRLPGPNGGFAILRAVSDTHADIAFRVHAEIEPESNGDIRAFFTPAHFSGNLLINKKTGCVEAFRLGVPTEGRVNAMLTAVLPHEALLDLIEVERMELVSPRIRMDPIEWVEEIPTADARQRLKQEFYGFMDIAWVPPEEATSLAQNQGRPIFAIVMWGSLDDQSC